MGEELKVVLRRAEDSSFGFRLLGTTGPPHVIYDVDENCTAADCGAIEAGDIILKVNGTDVHRYTTKEVLKCLRLSDDLVTLELKRDPTLKARLKEQLANSKSPHYTDIESHSAFDYRTTSTSPSATSTHHQQKQQEHHYHLQDAYDTQNSNSNVGSYCVADSGSSPALRYKSPTNLQHFPTTTSPITAQSSNHSRNSSASSAKIQLVETNASSAANTGVAITTSPTCRPSRIPTALKAAQPKPPPVQHSPQHRRPKPSQIPTKASAVSSNGNATTTIAPFDAESAPLQHSNSYSGSTSRHRQQQKEQNSDPISAPPQPTKAPRFEAYMMTGDLILNLSRTPQSSNLIPAHSKKVDSLRDSPNRSATAVITRSNGTLAPRASGESSPTSSSSVESPTHTASSDSVNLQQKLHKRGGQLKHQQQQQLLQQQHRDNINNSYNNSNSEGGSGERHQYRKDSITNDTLLLCEELERDEDNEEGEYIVQEEEEDEAEEDEIEGGNIPDNNYKQRQQKQYRQFYQQQHQQQRYRRRQQQNSYEHYQNEEDAEEEGDDLELEENEEDQTHYDITNIETYNSGGIGGGGVVGGGVCDEASDRQCLVMHYADNADDDEEFSSNSLASASAKQRLRALKQKAAVTVKYNKRGGVSTDSVGADSVDCSRHHHHHHRHQHSGGSSGSSSATVRSDGIGANTSQDETSFSVPTSPISLSTPLIDKETANSVPTSPEPSSLGAVGGVGGSASATAADSSGVVRRHNGVVRKCDSAGFRTSKSEDHLQQIQREGIAAVIPIDIDEDVNSSLNTLLDTRQDSEDSQASNRDRIVWTYNAPLSQLQLQQQQQQQQQYSSTHYGNNSSPNSHSSSISSSPQHSAGSPASPTSVSSSVMSSSGSKGALGLGGSSNNGHHLQQQQQQHQQQLHNNNGTMTSASLTMGLLQCPSNGGGSSNMGGGGSVIGGDHSVSEAISNISSPDYQDDDNLLSSRDLLGGMILSDPSDSDSTILVSDAALQRHQQQQQQKSQQSEHKLVIQVRGIDSSNSVSPRSVYSELKDSEDELATLTDEPSTTVLAASSVAGGGAGDGRDSSPPVSDDGSDVESLHSYHYSPKAVDMPSAIRLAKRLYSLDGFKKSDVSRHLSKNNDFSRAVADEYLKYFNFEKKTLDQSLREFLQQFSLSGETQERERVLVHFSKRFLDCNPGSFNSQDAVHTLTCAIMLLNTDLHGQNIGRKMTCAEFVENLAELNDGDNFPKDVLKYLYQAIKTQPLEWALDEEAADLQKPRTDINIGAGSGSHVGQNPFLDIPESSTAVEYKKGYVMRKCCYDSNYKKTPFGKRSWKMFYCTLRDLVLFLHKDEHGFRKSQMSDNLHNAIRIHHALATKASDYTKKQHVFRLQTADQAEYLFQTSDSKELQSWVETINFVCAAYSAPPIEGGVGSQKRFQRPLLPSTHTKLLMKEQLEGHELQLTQLENTLLEHKKGPVPSKGLPLQNYKEKENYLQYELRRYKAYVSILSAKLLADQQQLEQLQNLQSDDEAVDTFPMGMQLTQPQPQTQSQQQQQQQQQIMQSNSIIVQQQQQQQQQQSANRKKEKKK